MEKRETGERGKMEGFRREGKKKEKEERRDKGSRMKEGRGERK